MTTTTYVMRKGDEQIIIKIDTDRQNRVSTVRTDNAFMSTALSAHIPYTIDNRLAGRYHTNGEPQQRATLLIKQCAAHYGFELKIVEKTLNCR